MQKWRFSLGCAVLAATLLCGCGEDGGQRPDITGGDDEPPENPTYTADVRPIIAANCGCHQPGGIMHATAPLDSYANVFARRQLVKTRAGVAGTMPPTGPLPPVQRQTIIAWVDRGAPE